MSVFFVLLVVLSCGSPTEEVTPPATPAVLVEEPEAVSWLAGGILPGKGMEDSLLAVDGFGIRQAMDVVNGLREHVDFRYLKAGQPFRLVLSDDGERIERFVFSPDPVTHHWLRRDPESGAFVYQLEEYPTERRLRLIQGTLETTLNQALKDRKDVSDTVRGVVNGVLECLVSFRTHARVGDRYTILVEDQLYDGEIVTPSRVLYTAYRGRRAGFHEAFGYDDGDKSSSWNGHYSEQGKALVHSAMRYPLDRIHVTSPFGRRRHPVTGKWSMHYGVDYRARVGTPVYSVAKGTVEKTGRTAIAGRFVVVRHMDGTRTYYQHLSRISVKRGQSVKARGVVGRSGATGRVSGPHLHFAVRTGGGKWLNPLMQKMIAAPKLDKARKVKLGEQIVTIRDELATARTTEPALAEISLSAPIALGDVADPVTTR